MLLVLVERRREVLAEGGTKMFALDKESNTFYCSIPATYSRLIVVVPRTVRGGVRRAVPKGFPYFHVEWDDGGYAHVIEGEVSRVRYGCHSEET